MVAGAGLALGPMSLLSFSPAALPFLVPAGFLAWRGLSGTEPWPRSAGFAAAVDAVLACGALAALFVHDDPADWYTADGTHHGSSDIITETEVLFSLSLSALVVLVAFAAPTPGRGQEDVRGEGLRSTLDTSRGRRRE
jgi:hypothetical protein